MRQQAVTSYPEVSTTVLGFNKPKRNSWTTVLFVRGGGGLTFYLGPHLSEATVADTLPSPGTMPRLAPLAPLPGQQRLVLNFNATVNVVVQQHTGDLNVGAAPWMTGTAPGRGAHARARAAGVRAATAGAEARAVPAPEVAPAALGVPAAAVDAAAPTYEEKVAAAHGLEVITMRGDGACGYRAVAECTNEGGGLNDGHLEVRAEVVAALDQDEMEPFVVHAPGEKSPGMFASWTDYVAYMENPKSYIDQVAWRIIGKKRKILVLSIRGASFVAHYLYDGDPLASLFPGGKDVSKEAIAQLPEDVRILLYRPEVRGGDAAHYDYLRRPKRVPCAVEPIIADACGEIEAAPALAAAVAEIAAVPVPAVAQPATGPTEIEPEHVEGEEAKDDDELPPLTPVVKGFGPLRVQQRDPDVRAAKMKQMKQQLLAPVEETPVQVVTSSPPPKARGCLRRLRWRRGRRRTSAQTTPMATRASSSRSSTIATATFPWRCASLSSAAPITRVSPQQLCAGGLRPLQHRKKIRFPASLSSARSKIMGWTPPSSFS